MRILLTSAFFAPEIGGIPSLLKTLILEMQQWNIKFYIITNTVSPQPFPNCEFINTQLFGQLRRLSQIYNSANYTTWKSQYGAICDTAKRLAHEVKNLNLDAIFSHTDNAVIDFVAQELNIPHVAVIHGVYPSKETLINDGQQIVPFYDELTHLVNRMKAHTVFVSCYLRDIFWERGLKPRNSFIVYNPVPFSQFYSPDAKATELLRKQLNIPSGGKIVCYPQRIRGFGVSFLFHGMNELITLNSDAYFLVCGCNSMDDIAKYELSDLLRDRVRFGSFSSTEMRSIYSLSDVVILPNHDSFGLPSFEALSCGTPIVGVKTAAFFETLGNNRFVKLFDDGDKDAMIHCLLETLRELPLHRDIGKKSLLTQEEMDMCDPAKIAHCYYSIIKYAVANHTEKNIQSKFYLSAKGKMKSCSRLPLQV